MSIESIINGIISGLIVSGVIEYIKYIFKLISNANNFFMKFLILAGNIFLVFTVLVIFYYILETLILAGWIPSYLLSANSDGDGIISIVVFLSTIVIYFSFFKHKFNRQ